MYLESMTDQQFNDLGERRQIEIIADHCGGIEEKIRSAHSRKEAEMIAGETCGRFQESCFSALVQRALVERTNKIIELHWGKGEDGREGLLRGPGLSAEPRY